MNERSDTKSNITNTTYTCKMAAAGGLTFGWTYFRE